MFRNILRMSAFAHALTRIGIGSAFLLAPKRTVEPWVGPSYDTDGGRALLRAFAVRDILLGGAQLSALMRGAGARSLFRWGVLAEAVDVPAAMVAQRSGEASQPGLMNAMGALGLAGGVFLAVALPED